VFSHEFHELPRISSLEPATHFVLIREIRGKERFVQQSPFDWQLQGAHAVRL